MKKWIALFLALLICLSLCACGSGDSSTNGSASAEATESADETTPETVWVVQKSVDEFGDETEDSETIITAPIDGDFSNTATESSELGGSVSLFRYGDKYVPYFILMEYNDHKATYTSSDLNEGITLKVKIGDDVNEYSLTGNTPNGVLIINEPHKPYTFFYELYSNKQDAKCIITIGSSQYNFTIQYANLAEVCEEVFNIPAGEIESSTDVIRALFAYARHGDCYYYLKDNLNEYPIVKTDELANLIQSRWLSIEVASGVNDWYMFDYTTENTRKQVARLNDGVFEMSSNSFEEGNYAYRVADDLLYTETYGGSEKAAKFYKISDGYYVVDEGGKLYLYVQYTSDNSPAYAPQT